MDIKRFLNIDYLNQGTYRQKALYCTLKRHRIMDILVPFTPVVTGTIPIMIDTPLSDVDIACFWPYFIAFEKAFENLVNQWL